ncbi:MAG: 30S ribosomal protein S9, partial [Spirochaetia bacterium]
VNGKSVEEYFAGMTTAQNVRSPLDVTNNAGKFDVLITVKGGGVSSQIEACRHGIARALNTYDPTNHIALRANGFLTRDSRMVERKKYGQAGARRRFQFSKR